MLSRLITNAGVFLAAMILVAHIPWSIFLSDGPQLDLIRFAAPIILPALVAWQVDSWLFKK